MKVIEFEVEGRRAFLADRSNTAKVKDLFSFSVPSAFYSPAYRVWAQEKAAGIPEEERRGWNGKKSMFERNHIPVGLLKGMKAEILEKENIRLKIKNWEYRPHVALQEGFDESDESYKYQNFCVESMISCIGAYGGGLVLAATGVGKTKIAGQFSSHIDGDILFVVDTIDLMYQSQTEIQEWLEKKGYDKKVGVVGNSKFEPERVTVATIQTLQKHRNTAASRKWTKNIDVIIIDEIHSQMGRRNFDVVTSIKPQAVIGLTATLQMKKKPVKYKAMSIAGPVIFEFPITEGVEAGVLTQGVCLQVTVPDNTAERREIKKYKIKPGSLAKARKLVLVEADDYEHHTVYHEGVDKVLFDLIKEGIARDYKIIALVERVKHVKRLNKLLSPFDPTLCYGAVGKEDRKAAIKEMDKGKNDLIIANGVFKKGINVKRVDLIIDLAQRANKDDILQKFGRGVRLHRKKDGLLFITITTDPANHKAWVSQRSAFKKAKIPIDDIPSHFGAKNILDKAERLLSQTLKKNKPKPEQRKLF